MNKKIILFVVFSFVMLSCNNVAHSDKEQQNKAETSDVYGVMSVIESKIEEVTIQVDNNFNKLLEERTKIKEAEKLIAAFTEGSAEYIMAKNDLKEATKAQQEVLKRINNKYSEYLGYNLSVYSTDEVAKSACDLIKAVIREEMLKEYANSEY